MIWIDNIGQLQYYNQPRGLPCYCETLLHPNDVLLQGTFVPQGATYTIDLYVYSADGLTQYEDASTLFSYYFAVNPTTKDHYFTARLNQWAESMCEHKCFIIRAVVTSDTGLVAFDKYTERYCQSECCDTATDVDFEQDGQVTSTTDPTVFVSENPFIDDCGQQYIRISSKDNCYNIFNGLFYGVPTTIISGSEIGFFSATNIRGRIVKRPTEIQRNISYNCELQRVESTPVYLLEGFELFPTWKMNEIEGMLHSEFIWVQDSNGIGGLNQYKYDGGVPFRKPNGALDCTELWKLETLVQGCRKRATYGCAEPCDNVGYEDYNSFYIIPENFTSGFFNEGREFVGDTIEDLIDYLRTLNDITGVSEISAISPASPPSPAGCDFYAVIGITGNGYIPTSFYYNSISPQNRVFGVTFDEASEVCDFLSTTCAMPSLTFLASVPDCDTPTLSFVPTAEDGDVADITGFEDWVLQSDSPPTDEALVWNNQVKFSIHVVNSTIIPTAEDTYTFEGEIIGIMGAAARPASLVVLNTANNYLSEGQYLTVDEFGLIRYSGEPTTYNVGENVEIEFTNLVYNIP